MKERHAPPSEEELISRAQKGDRSAFEALYRNHVGGVYAICLRLCRDADAAEALTQDAFVRAWMKLGRYEGRGAFGGWLRRLAVNVVIEERRTGARRARIFMHPPPGDEGGAWVREAAGPWGGEAAAGDERIDLERAIAELPAGARDVFVLHDVNGYRYEEIAGILGVAVGTVKSQLHRARRILRTTLEKE